MSARPRGEQPPIVIAGGGVVGVALALFLARRGVPAIVLEQALEPNALPRAHALNPRSIEILGELGIDSARLRAEAAPRELTSEVRFVTTLTGHCFGALPYERQDDDVLAVTPTPILNIPQPAFEAILFELAADQPLVELRRGHRWVAAEQQTASVTSTVETAEGRYELESRYLIGADGAGSAVRESLGIGMAGVEEVAAAISITFAADLTDAVRDRPGVLHWVFGPPHGGTLLAYLPDRLWSYIITTEPGWVEMEQYSLQRAEHLVREALGPGAAGTAIEVIGVVPWTMRAQVSHAYRLGNVFLAGDSAHRFPPTGGLGLNTGLQDAHNLAWKLAAVLRGWAGDELLDSYESERQAVARRNADQSLLNLKELAPLSILGQAPPESDPDRLAEWLAAPGRTEAVAEAIERQRPHFDSLALQLGFSYNPDDEPIADASRFVPRAAVGRRLPHGWLTIDGERASVLEVLDPDAFTLLLLDESAPAPDLRTEAPVTTVRLGGGPEIQRWMTMVGLEGCLAVLVRPDGHTLAVARRPEELAGLVRSIEDLVGSPQGAAL